MGSRSRVRAPWAGFVRFGPEFDAPPRQRWKAMPCGPGEPSGATGRPRGRPPGPPDGPDAYGRSRRVYRSSEGVNGFSRTPPRFGMFSRVWSWCSRRAPVFSYDYFLACLSIPMTWRYRRLMKGDVCGVSGLAPGDLTLGWSAAIRDMSAAYCGKETCGLHNRASSPHLTHGRTY